MMASLVAQMVKTSPAMQSLGWEDPLEKKMATHSSIHAWRIPWMEGPSPLCHKESDMTEQLTQQYDCTACMWNSISDQVTENTSFYNCNNLITKY